MVTIRAKQVWNAFSLTFSCSLVCWSSLPYKSLFCKWSPMIHDLKLLRWPMTRIRYYGLVISKNQMIKNNSQPIFTKGLERTCLDHSASILASSSQNMTFTRNCHLKCKVSLSTSCSGTLSKCLTKYFQDVIVNSLTT